MTNDHFDDQCRRVAKQLGDTAVLDVNAHRNGKGDRSPDYTARIDMPGWASREATSANADEAVGGAIDRMRNQQAEQPEIFPLP